MEKKFDLCLNTKMIDIEFKNVVFCSKGKKCVKQILKGVSGKFASGELTAIMGPSGAGKTSLLNILTGYQTAGTTGTITCSGSPGRKKGALQYKKESCYILQDDNLPALFTVQEMMTMAANLKISDLTQKAKDYLIEEILCCLGLQMSRNTRCQNLSGGQRKRLSIALELVDNPPIMFLDEPTTGLDSSSSTQCIEMLKDLARGGRTIIATIHQPSSSIYMLFDQIYMMSQGLCVYQGSSINTIPYLASMGFHCPQYHNPADYFLEVVSGEYGDCLEQLASAAMDNKWRRNIPIIKIGSGVTDINNDVSPYPNEKSGYQTPTEWTRFLILTKRYGTQLYRDWTISQLKLLMHVLVGIFLGVVYQNCGWDASKTINNLGLHMCGLAYITYTSIMPAVLKFPSEVAILKKERFNNWYKLRTYYLAFLVFDIPIQFIFAAAYTSTSYLISAQPLELDRFFKVLIIQALVALASSGFGLILGTVVNPVNGTFFGAIYFAVLVCFGGFLILFPHMSKLIYLLTYMSFISFALEGIMQAVYGYNRTNLICPDDIEYCHYKSPSFLLEELGMSKPTFLTDVVYLTATFIAYRSIAFFTLRRQLSSST